MATERIGAKRIFSLCRQCIKTTPHISHIGSKPHPCIGGTGIMMLIPSTRGQVHHRQNRQSHPLLSADAHWKGQSLHSHENRKPCANVQSNKLSEFDECQGRILLMF